MDGSINPGYQVTEKLNKLFQEKANELLFHRNKQFEISSEEYRTFYRAVIWFFSRNHNFLDSPLLLNPHQADFHKGLIVLGNNGVGKSFVFQVLNELNPFLMRLENNFSYMHSDQAVSMYDVSGTKGIMNLFKGQRYFDDLGTEEKGSHFKTIELFKILIERRHFLFTSQGLKTFMSSNLTRDGIADRYGLRVESRLYEMFNIIYVPAEIEDKRKK